MMHKYHVFINKCTNYQLFFPIFSHCVSKNCLAFIKICVAWYIGSILLGVMERVVLRSVALHIMQDTDWLYLWYNSEKHGNFTQILIT